MLLKLVVSSFIDPKSSLKFHVTFLQSRMVKVKILSNSSKGKLKACYSQRKIPAGFNNNKNISMWDFSQKYFWLKIKIEIFNWNLNEEKEIIGLYKFESYVQTYRKLQWNCLKSILKSPISLVKYVYTRHIPIAHSGHGHYGPPEPVWYRLEVTQRASCFGKVDSAAKEDHSWNRATMLCHVHFLVTPLLL